MFENYLRRFIAKKNPFLFKFKDLQNIQHETKSQITVIYFTDTGQAYHVKPKLYTSMMDFKKTRRNHRLAETYPPLFELIMLSLLAYSDEYDKTYQVNIYFSFLSNLCIISAMPVCVI